MDLINRADAIDALKLFGAEHNAIAVIKGLPSAEPCDNCIHDEEDWDSEACDGCVSAERKGDWLRYGEDGNPNTEDTAIWQCDQCLETYYGRTTRIPKYCPNCGADMRGEQDE